MKAGDTEAGRNEDAGSDLPLGQRKTHGHQVLNRQVSRAALERGPCRDHWQQPHPEGYTETHE